eukprot:5575088-Prymnesium_polylepis.1
MRSSLQFSTTGALEGQYAIATGALRVLSEQQLMDCSWAEGNKGCGGGAMDQTFEYIIANGGLDNEKEYGYTGSDESCWSAAESRHVATMVNFTDVPKNDEAALVAAAATTPISVAIDAGSPAFQHYASGIFDNATCGVALDHGVLLVGYTADAFIVVRPSATRAFEPAWGGGVAFRALPAAPS